MCPLIYRGGNTYVITRVPPLIIELCRLFSAAAADQSTVRKSNCYYYSYKLIM